MTEPHAPPATRDEAHADDRLYLDLKGARERLCRAQTSTYGLPRADVLLLNGAIARIDEVAAKLPQWSEHDRSHELPATRGELRDTLADVLHDYQRNNIMDYATDDIVKEFRQRAEAAEAELANERTAAKFDRDVAADRIKAAEAKLANRCLSCEHSREHHQSDGCWFTVESARIRSVLTCPCGVIREYLDDT